MNQRDMEFHFKIYNPDIIDCSSCPNAIFPNPESIELLLDILLKMCESDVVARIGTFDFWINYDKLKLYCPPVCGTADIYGEVDIIPSSNQDELNKISGLVILREETTSFSRRKAEINVSLEPGLEGLRTAIKYVRSMANNQFEELPTEFHQIELRSMIVSLGVIWGMNEKWRRDEDGTYEGINYEHDYIRGEYRNSYAEFTFGNFGGDSFDIFNSPPYLNHLNKIQKILDELAPGKYEPGPYEEYPDMINFGIFNRKEREFQEVEREAFREAIARYTEYIEETNRSPAAQYIKEMEERNKKI